jgi:hypothetical protein
LAVDVGSAREESAPAAREVRHSAPPHARPSGPGPYWSVGEVVLWQERSPVWRVGEPWDVTPVRVVRDDAAGLVVWLAPATPQLMPRLADGASLRSLPLPDLYRTPRVQARVAWRGPGSLRIAPTGTPWSVWLFWSDDGGFSGWYVNLEQPHAREARSTWTCDHELDVWIEPDGTGQLKDTDGLAAAVDANWFTAAESQLIRARADLAQAQYAQGHWAFDEAWTRWRPDPAWTAPTLPDDLAWDIDLIAQER